MHKLRSFFYKNKYKIFKILGILIFIIILIQLLNFFAGRDNNVSNIKQNITELNEDNKGLVSDKSAVTGQSIEKETLKNSTDIINEFMTYCNQHDIEKAYSLLTDECKNEMYRNVNSFEQSYYKNVFNGEKRNYTIENWVGDIYRVNITGDLLATGKNDNGYSKQDYITIKEVDNEYKLNINNYIGYSKIDKITADDNISVEVISKNTYKDYEEYTIKVTNKTNDIMQLDNISNTKTLYLEDSNENQYSYYNHELTTSILTVQSGQTKELTIKFYNTYISTKNIEYMVFSNIILKNGQLSEKIEFKANV